MRFTTWKELLKEEMFIQNESGITLKGCNLSDIKMLGCFGQHWDKKEGELVAWTKERNYFSTKENGLNVVKSEKRIKKEC